MTELVFVTCKLWAIPFHIKTVGEYFFNSVVLP